jgi:hypothetical protein
VFKLLVDQDFILKDMRMGGPLGNRKLMMHVALSDKMYAILDETHLALAATFAELALKDHAKAALTEKAMAAYAAGKLAAHEAEIPEPAPKKPTWEEIMADPDGPATKPQPKLTWAELSAIIDE